MEMSMTALASLLMSSVVAAGPATPLPWYSFDDYPMKAFEREWQGVATFALVVGPDGKPADCKIVVSTGHDVLDRQTCWVAMKRPRFTPAYGPDGKPTYGVYRSQVVWTRPDRPTIQRDPGPDLEIIVRELPAGTTDPAAVKVAYYVDVSGNASQCTALPDNRQPPALVQAACEQLLAKPAREPVSAKGSAVPAVKTAAVKFTAAK
jgi:TonB family protein